MTPFFQINLNFSHQVAQKRAKNCNCQRIYNKNTYVQRSDFTPALQFYPISAWLARYIFHVCTELSNHTRELKDNGMDFRIDWTIWDRAQPFNPTSKKCRLCLIEKYHLMFSKECATLNRRTEFYAACRHKTKKLISNG